MRYRIFVAFLLVSLSACSFQAQTLRQEPTVEPGSGLLTAPPVNTSTDTPLPSVTSTNTPELLPAFTSTPLEHVEGIYPIQFAPNGTYIDLADILYPGESNTYVINAMGGQIMSVSIFSFGYFSIEIKGDDGSVLCPVNMNAECNFWRGKLPSSQNYFITVKALTDQRNFTLRVAVNPPGEATQFFMYESYDRHATLQFSDEFAPVYFSDIPVYKIQPELTLEFINSDFYTNTNLHNAYLLYGSTTDPGIVANCTQLLFDGEEQVIDHVTVNGVDFVRSEGAGAAAGTLYNHVYYRTVYNDTCYEITIFVESGNIGHYPAELGIQEFDRDTLMKRFEDVLFTFHLQ